MSRRFKNVALVLSKQLSSINKTKVLAFPMFISPDNVEDVGQFHSEVTVNVYRAVNLVWTGCLTCQFLNSFLNVTVVLTSCYNTDFIF